MEISRNRFSMIFTGNILRCLAEQPVRSKFEILLAPVPPCRRPAKPPVLGTDRPDLPPVSIALWIPVAAGRCGRHCPIGSLIAALPSISLHWSSRFPRNPDFLPKFLPELPLAPKREPQNTLYIRAFAGNLPAGGRSLPSWSCGFDSRHPLSSLHGRSEAYFDFLRGASRIRAWAAGPLRARSLGIRARFPGACLLRVGEQLAHAFRDFSSDVSEAGVPGAASTLCGGAGRRRGAVMPGGLNGIAISAVAGTRPRGPRGGSGPATAAPRLRTAPRTPQPPLVRRGLALWYRRSWPSHRRSSGWLSGP
jgi:hypothetical protein